MPDQNDHLVEELLSRLPRRDRLTDRGRAVIDTLAVARAASTEFLLACGLLPEISETCTERLHYRVHEVGGRFFDRRSAEERLDGLLQRHGIADEELDAFNHAIFSLLGADTTVAYVLGLAAGLGVGSVNSRLEAGEGRNAGR